MQKVVPLGLAGGQVMLAAFTAASVAQDWGGQGLSWAIWFFVVFVVLTLFHQGLLYYRNSPKLDIVFDPTDQSCMLVTQDDRGRTARMFRVIVVNRSWSTVEGVRVFITNHADQASALLPQRLRFKDERFQGQLSEIRPGSSAKQYIDVVSHYDASDDSPIVMHFALTDIPNTLAAGRRYILTLVAEAYNCPEQIKQFQIDTCGQFGALTFKPYYAPSRYALRLFGREFSVSKTTRI